MTNATDQSILLSKKGMQELRKQIARLEHDQRAAIQALRELDRGVSHEERLARVEKLAHLEAIESDLGERRLTLQRAKLLPTRRARLRVALGSVVDLVDQQGRLFRYTLVDSIEADPSDGRISVKSPLGSSLVGKAVKDTVEWGNGLRMQSLQLVSIN